MEFHISVNLFWLYRGNKRDISINALIDTNVEAMIFDTDFMNQMMMPRAKRQKRLRLEAANSSLLPMSSLVHTQNVQIVVPRARLGCDKTLNLLTEVACLDQVVQLL